MGILMKLVAILLISVACDVDAATAPRKGFWNSIGKSRSSACNLLIPPRLYSIRPQGVSTSRSCNREVNPPMSSAAAHACRSAWQRQAGKELRCYQQHKNNMMYKGRKWAPYSYHFYLSLQIILTNSCIVSDFILKPRFIYRLLLISL